MANNGDGSNAGPPQPQIQQQPPPDEVEHRLGSMEENLDQLQNEMKEMSTSVKEIAQGFQNFQSHLDRRLSDLGQPDRERDSSPFFALGQQPRTDEEDPITSDLSGARQVQAGGAQSLAVYGSLFSKEMAFEMGRSFQQGIKGGDTNVVELTTVEDLITDVLHKKEFNGDKLLMRGKAGEIQRMLGLSYTSQVSSKLTKSHIASGKIGIVPRTYLKVLCDLSYNLWNKMIEEEKDGGEDPPKSAMMKYNLLFVIFSRAGMVGTSLLVTGGRYAEAAALISLYELCDRLKSEAWEAVLEHVMSDAYFESVKQKMIHERDTHCKKEESAGGTVGVRKGLATVKGAMANPGGRKRMRETPQGSYNQRDLCHKYWKWEECSYGETCKFLHVFGNGADLPPQKRARTDGNKSSTPMWRRKTNVVNNNTPHRGFQPYRNQG